MNWGNTEPPKVQGDATDDNHFKWIVLDSVRPGITRKNVPQEGNKYPIDIMEIVVTKRHDSSSSPLYREALAGNGDPVIVMLDIVGQDRTLSIRLTDTVISKFALSAGGESFSLNSPRIEWGFDQYVTPHTTPPPVPGYDLRNMAS